MSDNNLDPNSITDPVIKAKLIYVMEKSLLQLEAERWRARRNMAWVSLAGIMLFTACMLFFVKPTIMSALADVVTWFYLSTTSIIGVYIGSSAMTYIAAVKAKVLPTSATITDENPASIITPFDDIEKEVMKSRQTNSAAKNDS